jgi:hypothetical protein
MGSKIPMARALDIALIAETMSSSEIEELFEELLSAEKEEIQLAWMDGNRKGWEMETDWPESATEYFNNRFID